MNQEDPRILELRRVRAKAKEGGEERNAKQRAKGKMTARERIDALLDPGTFNELEPFITHQGDGSEYRGSTGKRDRGRNFAFGCE